MRPRNVFVCGLMCITMSGCDRSEEPNRAPDAHHHDAPSHMPRSLQHLCDQIRIRLSALQIDRSDARLHSELTDLISWAPEFAADTDIGEQGWIPIYDLSEKIRTSIQDDPKDWSVERCDQVTRLCQIAEDAWQSLQPNQRVERYRGHHHSHDEHDHGDHGHDEHDHDEHDHDEHDHDEHDHDEHGHGDHDEHDHGDPAVDEVGQDRKVVA